MALELGKFVSLLFSILCFCALLHSAFFAQTAGFDERILASLKMLALAAAACWTSGWIFRLWERRTGIGNPRVVATLPMKMFCWASAVIGLLFAASWYFETYYLPLRTIPPW